MAHVDVDFVETFGTNSITALALEAARLGAWQASPAGMVMWDKRTREIHGVDLNKPLTLEDAETAVYSDDRPVVQRAVAEAARPGGPGYYEVEYRINRGELPVRWAASFARVMTNNGVIVGFRGVVQDVTTHKHAEEMRELLVHELDHRTKNILGVVQSLARTTLSNAGIPAAALRTYLERLNALGRCQAALVASDGHFSADIHKVVAEAVSPFMAQSCENIRISGPNLNLTSDMVMTLSLVLHELLTNAAKYGALSTEAGCVDLSWNLGDTLDISWREAGGPLVHPSAKSGFGTQLIHGLLNYKVGKTDNVRIEHLPTGVQCMLRVPL